MKTTPTVRVWCFLPAFLFILSCSGDEDDEFSQVGTNTSIAEITGNWNATQGLFDRATEGPIAVIDVVAEGGSVTLNITSNGRFTLTVNQVGGATEVTTGSLAFDEDLLVVFFDDDPGEWEYFSITHNEPNLTISGGNGSSSFDFDGDGTEEPANVYFEFTRI